MDIILATRNVTKTRQIRAIFIGSPVTVWSLDDARIQGDFVEDGATLEENALKKALFAWKRSGERCMADDTGLFIDALGGEPGIHAARWAGEG